ncbi:hypothetical protein DFH08DRAFT_811561 [Mycena albidolilacea]|uniref:Uncharacterized protein n=1 Tax=Mycena albidolilacea TaxID=1033008 RepID=A0AAD6ZWU2_9AGAR|nr:hypothetical protein DFH08DRAFT_811561 [Mycena albidolilacea]
MRGEVGAPHKAINVECRRDNNKWGGATSAPLSVVCENQNSFPTANGIAGDNQSRRVLELSLKDASTVQNKTKQNQSGVKVLEVFRGASLRAAGMTSILGLTSLTCLYRYHHKCDTFLFVVLGSYRTSTGVIETLTQTRPWWHHVNKPDSLEQRYKSSTDKAPQDDAGTADYPRAMTTVDDSCDGGQAANEPEARERSRCRVQPLSRHVVSRPAREQGPERTLNRAAKRRWRGGAARGETKGEPRHRAAGRHTRQRTMHDGRKCETDYSRRSGGPLTHHHPPRCTPHADRHSARTPEAQAPIDGAQRGLTTAAPVVHDTQHILEAYPSRARRKMVATHPIPFDIDGAQFRAYTFLGFRGSYLATLGTALRSRGSVRGIPGSEFASCRDDFHIGFDKTIVQMKRVPVSFQHVSFSTRHRPVRAVPINHVSVNSSAFQPTPANIQKIAKSARFY